MKKEYVSADEKRKTKLFKKRNFKSVITKILVFGGFIISLISAFLLPTIVQYADVPFSGLYDIITVINGISIFMIFLGVVLWMMTSDKPDIEDITETEKRQLDRENYKGY